MRVAGRTIYEWATRVLIVTVIGLAACGQYLQAKTPQGDPLRNGFESPPDTAKVRCYWWWLNGNTTDATITRDLEEMKSHGLGGAILVDADGSGQEGNLEVPPGPSIGSPQWIAHFVHALSEAQRLGLEISLNITSRLDVGIIGGPSVSPEDTMKLLTYSRAIVEGGGDRTLQLVQPPDQNAFYRPIATLAYPLHHGPALPGSTDSERKAIGDLRFKDAAAETGFSMPPSDQVLRDQASVPGEEDTGINQVLDLSAHVDVNGSLTWNFPAGTWEVLRIGYTDTSMRLIDSSGTPRGLPLDVMSKHAFDDYWRVAVTPLLEAAKPYIGTSLRYLVTDSWEAGGTNWTEGFREEFKRRRGYDPVPYLPVVAGRILGCRETSNRFLFDLRRTVADLIAENYYDRFSAYARKSGLGTHPEAGGPHGAPIDALENFRSTSFPQTEFWATTGAHRVNDRERFFVKEASSAAHIYGKPFVAAEGPTSMNPEPWSESLGKNLQPAFDRALTEGLNLLFWHEFTSSPAKYGLPGQEYFAGTHLNPNVTWWNQAPSLLLAFSRAQFLLQQGQPVADLLYFYGDQVPGFVRVKNDDPAHVLPGYDYDVTDEDALLSRLQFKAADLSTPEGVHYRALALPASGNLSYAALQWVSRFLLQGGTVIGLKPTGPLGHISKEEGASYQKLADTVWSGCNGDTAQVHYGKGRVICASSSRSALELLGVSPDFSYKLSERDEMKNVSEVFDYVHRRTATADIYFVRNTLGKVTAATFSFRVHDATPKLWMPDDGSVTRALVFRETKEGRTEVPLEFPAMGSIFIVFEHTSSAHLTNLSRDGIPVYPSINSGSGVFASGPSALVTREPGTYHMTDSLGHAKTIVVSDALSKTPAFGAWTLAFPSGWGAPGSATIDRFGSWTESQDPGIRYFSGTGTYRSTLAVQAGKISPDQEIWLDLGDVREIASVKVNGTPVGTMWRAPFTVRIDHQLRAGKNTIEIQVTNLWPNRLIGDMQPSALSSLTHTNVRAYTKDSPLMPSGLLTPVTVTVQSIWAVR